MIAAAVLYSDIVEFGAVAQRDVNNDIRVVIRIAG